MTGSLMPIVVALAAASALLSASEVALFSLNRFQIRFLRDQFPKVHGRVRQLLSDPSGVLLTILLFNELCNVGLSTLVATEVNAQSPTDTWWQAALAGIGISLPIVILVCEVTPKILGSRLNQLVVGPLSAFLAVLYWLVAPLRKVAALLGLQKRQSGPQNAYGESDFLVMVEQGHREGTIRDREFELIRNVFDLDDTRTSEVLTPLSQLTLFPSDMKVSEAAAHMDRHRLFRVPVYKEHRSQVTGILYAKDILEAGGLSVVGSQKIAALAREPFVVSESARINQVFRQMRLNQTHLAVVHDAKRKALGVIALGDILKELFEDSEGDEEPPTP